MINKARCLGKAPARKDQRTLRLKMVLNKALPVVPDTWDYDTGKIIPLPMFANDSFGDCVMAGRAHQTLRFELFQQGKIINLTDTDVLQEYMKETGGNDTGLVVLDSLKAWRNGWVVDGQTYNIHSFAAINPTSPDEVKAAAFGLSGLGSGFQLPMTAQTQLNANQPWDDVTLLFDGRKGSWGGHYVYIVGYNPLGPVCITWGKKQQMTWRFMARYCDELYGIVDDRDKFLTNQLIDVEALDKYLAIVEKSC